MCLFLYPSDIVIKEVIFAFATNEFPTVIGNTSVFWTPGRRFTPPYYYFPL